MIIKRIPVDPAVFHDILDRDLAHGPLIQKPDKRISYGLFCKTWQAKHLLLHFKHRILCFYMISFFLSQEREVFLSYRNPDLCRHEPHLFLDFFQLFSISYHRKLE